MNKWHKITYRLKELKVPALIAVVPDCKDERLAKREPISDTEFWTEVGFLKTFNIGIHGLHHENFGMMTQQQQEIWLKDSIKMFFKNMIFTNIFVPPNHSLNKFTVNAMKNMGLEYLSEGVGLYPWLDDDSEIVIVPQVLWTPRKVRFGVITFCMHPDTMTDDQIDDLFMFIDENKKDIISILDVETPIYGLINCPFAIIYKWFYSRKKGLKLR